MQKTALCLSSDFFGYFSFTLLRFVHAERGSNLIADASGLIGFVKWLEIFSLLQLAVSIQLSFPFNIFVCLSRTKIKQVTCTNHQKVY